MYNEVSRFENGMDVDQETSNNDNRNASTGRPMQIYMPIYIYNPIDFTAKIDSFL